MNQKNNPLGRFTYSSVRAFEYSRGEVLSSDVDLVKEAPLEISINEGAPTLLMFTPGMARELATGFVLTEGFVSAFDDIEGCEITEGQEDGDPVSVKILVPPDRLCAPPSSGSRIAFSSCGVCGRHDFGELEENLSRVRSTKRFSMEVLLQIPGRILDLQPLYLRTGGAHGAFLFDARGNALLSGEDMGRHNALDKVIGGSLIQGVDLQDKIIMSSGRASLEMILKTARAGVPVFIANSRPTSRAVEAARHYNITLIDMARSSNRIYTHARRISEFKN